MQGNIFLSLLVAGAAMASGQAHALGLGRANDLSLLGQPLSFKLALRLEADESLADNCVSADVMAGDQRVDPPSVYTFLEPSRHAGERTLRVVTSSAINEPIVTVNVSVGCPAQLTRQFVLFLDPPVVAPPVLAQADTPSGAAAAGAVPAPSAASAPAAFTSAEFSPSRRAEAPRRHAAVSRKAAPVRESRAKAAHAPVAVSRVPASGPAIAAKSTVAAQPAQKSRLRLDTYEPQTVAVAASAPQPQAAASAMTADNGASAAEALQRLQALEGRLGQMRSDSHTTQEKLRLLQAKLDHAEAAARHESLLIYALAALAAVLLAALVVVLRLNARGHDARSWMHGDVAEPLQGGAELREASASDASAPVAPEPEVPASPQVAVQPALPVGEVETRPAPFTTVAAGTALPAISAAALPAVQPDETKPPEPKVFDEQDDHGVSVEDLIDLEQQAEFFVVLGQDDAAIDLLRSHLRDVGTVSPLPYFKLLEIHRRRGEREAYDRVRERFKQQFDADVATWGGDLSRGRTLESYPEVIEHLQSLWRDPRQAMDALQALLLPSRRTGRSLFLDLLACRDALLLCSIARDLVEHPEELNFVDLPLPFGDDARMGSGVPAGSLHV